MKLRWLSLVVLSLFLVAAPAEVPLAAKKKVDKEEIRKNQKEIRDHKDTIQKNRPGIQDATGKVKKKKKKAKKAQQEVDETATELQQAEGEQGRKRAKLDASKGKRERKRREKKLESLAAKVGRLRERLRHRTSARDQAAAALSQAQQRQQALLSENQGARDAIRRLKAENRKRKKGIEPQYQPVSEQYVPLQPLASDGGYATLPVRPDHPYQELVIDRPREHYHAPPVPGAPARYVAADRYGAVPVNVFEE